MKKILCAIVLCFFILSGCTGSNEVAKQTKITYRTSLSPENEITIAYRPQPATVSEDKKDLISYPKLTYFNTYDVLGNNLAGLDLQNKLEELLITSFDTKTEWGSNLAKGFDPVKVMELGKNPGLGIKKLHDQGVNGEGVSIAFVGFDGLLTEHEEYKDQLKLYEEIHAIDDKASLWGTVMASLAVGKTTGIAPKANLYYIACFAGKYKKNQYYKDNTYLAAAVSRVVQFNQSLPSSEKIRILALEYDLHSQIPGYDELKDALQQARDSGIYVIDNVYSNYKSLHREPYLEPDDMESFRLPKMSVGKYEEKQWLFAPVDNRTFASPSGESDYVYLARVPQQVVTPYIVGLYALAYQVNPSISPYEFSNALRESAVLYPKNNKDKLYYIINPVKFIDVVKDNLSDN